MADLEEGKSKSSLLNVQRRFSHRARFKATVDPEVLLRCAHDLFLDNLVHIGSGLIFICRVAFHLWGDEQTISAVIRFSYHRYGQHGCARETERT